MIDKILTHLGLDPQPPTRGRAREPGQDQSHPSRAGRPKHLPQAATRNRNRSRRRATRLRGTIEIRVDPENEVARERHEHYALLASLAGPA